MASVSVSPVSVSASPAQLLKASCVTSRLCPRSCAAWLQSPARHSTAPAPQLVAAHLSSVTRDTSRGGTRHTYLEHLLTATHLHTAGPRGSSDTRTSGFRRVMVMLVTFHSAVVALLSVL